MPTAPEPVTAVPAESWQPWDATSSATKAGWKSVDGNSGPANASGQATGDFDSGSGWEQT